MFSIQSGSLPGTLTMPQYTHGKLVHILCVSADGRSSRKSHHHHHSPTHSEKAMYIVFYIPSILYLTIAAIIILLWVPLYLSLSPTRTQRLWSRPRDPYLLLIILLYDFHPLILGLWLLINGIWQTWWDVTPMTRLHYIKLCLTSRLTSETLFGSFEEASLDMNSANHLSELGHLIIASILQLEIWG